jgi:hypothetical protein
MRRERVALGKLGVTLTREAGGLGFATTLASITHGTEISAFDPSTLGGSPHAEVRGHLTAETNNSCAMALFTIGNRKEGWHDPSPRNYRHSTGHGINARYGRRHFVTH